MTKIEVRKSTTPSTDSRPTDVWTEMDRLFQDLHDRFYAGVSRPWFALATRGSLEPAPPLLDAEDHGKEYELRVDLPGVTKDQVDVRVVGNTVQIRAEGAQEKEESGKSYLRRERSWAGYQRSVELPERLRSDAVTARLDNGVLTVTLPKEHPVAERKVPVQ
jgi:HSP20 family protein